MKLQRNIVLANLIEWWIAACDIMSDEVAAANLMVDVETLQEFLMNERSLEAMPFYFEDNVKKMVLPDVKDAAKMLLSLIDNYYEDE